jgi:hypothetical protein
MATKFRIHPAVGIPRVGNSPTSFYIAPETTGGLPIDCDPDGSPIVKARNNLSVNSRTRKDASGDRPLDFACSSMMTPAPVAVR